MKNIETLAPVSSLFIFVENNCQEFPTPVDYNGAVGAIVSLQFAYEIDLKKLSDSRKIEYINSEGEKVNINIHEMLHGADYAAFTLKAFERQLYHIAIDFVRESLRLHEHKDEGVHMMIPAWYDMMQKMKKDLKEINNG